MISTTINAQSCWKKSEEYIRPLQRSISSAAFVHLHQVMHHIALKKNL
jgi:hypothetical protein